MSFAAWLILAAPAFAQPAAPTSSAPPVSRQPPSPDESAVVQELEVIGRPPGPALWRVSRGESQVVIVGSLSPLPHSLQWNTTRVQRALNTATALFLPPDKPRVGFFSGVGMLLSLGALRPPHGDLEAGLPPDLRARFDQTLARHHLDPKRYRNWKPAVAGLLLVGDFRRAEGLSTEKPNTTIARMARAARAQVITVGAVDAKPLFDAVARMSDPQNQACLAAALDDVAEEAAHARPAAEAWAFGDLRGVRANTSAPLLDKCLLQLPSVQSLVEKGTQEAVTSIDKALGRPGHSVAVIDLTFLLRPNGVLDRLKAQGAEIALPPY
jgi:uncharacterized protein YbaP (TraB family)